MILDDFWLLGLWEGPRVAIPVALYRFTTRGSAVITSHWNPLELSSLLAYANFYTTVYVRSFSWPTP